MNKNIYGVEECPKHGKQLFIPLNVNDGEQPPLIYLICPNCDYYVFPFNYKRLVKKLEGSIE